MHVWPRMSSSELARQSNPHPPDPGLTASISGSALHIERAEELIRSLTGVVSARIMADSDGELREIHVLTTAEVPAKQTVRNIESALMAHLGMRIDHRKISVAATSDTKRPAAAPVSQGSGGGGGGSAQGAPPPFSGSAQPRLTVLSNAPEPAAQPVRRRVYFEDVEVRGSRSRGVSCRVTLRSEGDTHIGEASGTDGDRARLELAARAALLAIANADGRERQLMLEGLRVLDMFDRRFVFVGVTVRSGRDARLLTGTCELRESGETSAVLAVLDATNRLIGSEV